MVTDKILIKHKGRRAKKTVKIVLLIFALLIILLVVFLFGYFIKIPAVMHGSDNVKIVLENPLKNIVYKNTDSKTGEVDKEKVISQAVFEFNEEYINYILAAMGIGKLHKSIMGENPKIKFILGEDIWSSEIINGAPNTKKVAIEDEDLRIVISKEEAVEALLSENIEEFMKNSVVEGRTGIEMVAGKAELFSKGYLDMYEQITGEKIKII
jgi:hypothetical protein